jgi:Asp-tRNA(Asn)/Glu-tRNA(Gln) amidotransferase A subunit family amidase
MPHQDLDLFDLTITEALEGLAGRRFSAREYAQSLIARSEEQKSLNALVSHDWDRLLEAADKVDASGKAGQKLGGIPLCLKDNINTGILPTGAATGALASHVARAAAPVAKALLMPARCSAPAATCTNLPSASAPTTASPARSTIPGTRT